MKLLVTGGAGFIGSHVAQMALERGHQVAVIDDLSNGKRENLPEGAEFHRADIRDRKAILELFRAYRPDAVSHQAAHASVSESVKDPVHDAEVNILGSLAVLEACQETRVGRLVFASTGGAIYGNVPPGKKADITWPPFPESPYGNSKWAFENYLRIAGTLGRLDYRILRYSNVYGPRQDGHGEAGVIAIFLTRLLAGQEIQVNGRCEPGDGGCVRDYVYVGDVARINLAAAEGRIAERITNVATGVGTTTLAVAKTIQKILGVRAVLRDGPSRQGDVLDSVLDPGGLWKAFGEFTELRLGLQETVDWYRSRPPGSFVNPTPGRNAKDGI